MSLDYSAGCVNFRDAGEWANVIAGRTLVAERRVLRGGKLEFVASAEDIGEPGSIINLRKGIDPEDRRFGADHWHFPISNDHEKYHTATPAVRRWLNAVLACVATEVRRWPVLFHCTSGKDRTGVVVAALLRVAGVPREVVIEEYFLSNGELRREWIEGALDGVGEPADYFRRVDLRSLRERLTS